MTLQELKNDLISKVSSDTANNYFDVKLFSHDARVFDRRSFDDLFKYYRSRGVSEKKLVQALYEEGFRGRLCSTLRKIVFFKPAFPKKAFLYRGAGFGYVDMYDTNIINSKYTPTYLKKLYNEVFNNKL